MRAFSPCPVIAALVALSTLLPTAALAAGNYPITRQPAETDWRFGPVIDALSGSLPPRVATWLRGLTPNALRRVVSKTYVQSMAETPGAPARRMAVELTVGLIDRPLPSFLASLPASRWGVNLAGYLGGEVQVVERDASGRPVRQIERMVLSALPCDANFRMTNLDMTKAEQIVYDDAGAKVAWRVYHSDNRSTESDIGTVIFHRFDASATLVTFHSAHRINALGGVHVPSDLTRLFLGTMFRDHIQNYRKIVQP